jgi:hypothetical protein
MEYMVLYSKYSLTPRGEAHRDLKQLGADEGQLFPTVVQCMMWDPRSLTRSKSLAC